MTQLLENKDYVRLGVNDLMNKAVEVIKKREEEKRDKDETI